MADGQGSLTGIWNGQYNYPFGYEPVGFMATLIETGARFSGGVTENCPGEGGMVVELFAVIAGRREGRQVRFTKTYDGSSGWDHIVEYDGVMSGDGNEIEGEWRVPGAMTGRFLMIRPERTQDRVARKEEAPV